MGTQKATPTRRPGARFSGPERAILRQIRATLDENDLALLFEVANWDPARWPAFPYTAWPACYGEPFDPATHGPDLQADARQALGDLAAGRFARHTHEPMGLAYRVAPGRPLRLYAPTEDLAQALDFAIFGLLLTGRDRNVRQCPECKRFHLGARATRRFCSDVCQDAHHNRLKARQAWSAKLRRCYGPPPKRGR